MPKESLLPEQTFVNPNRKEAAKWVYDVIAIDPGTPATLQAGLLVNQLAAEGWEPVMMSSTAVLLRRDATDAVDGDEETVRRSGLLKRIKAIK